MSYESYWRAHMRGIEDVEEEQRRRWEEVLALLLLLEGGLRKRIVTLALGVNLNRRRQVERFRVRARTEIDNFISAASIGIVGRSTLRTLYPAGTTGAIRGIQGAGIRAAAAVQADALVNAMNTLGKDGGIAPKPPGAAPVRLHPDQAGRFRQDLEDILIEADDNPIRGIHDGANRLMEDIISRTSVFARHGSARDVVHHMVGRDDGRTNDPSIGWRLHRGRMWMAVLSHIRAIHRRRTVSEALANGITNFRMDVPRRMLGHFHPDGVMGRQMWKIRSFDEWREEARKANTGRVGSTAWDSLGLGFKDFSYLTPIPDIYMEEAQAQGAKLRAKWLQPLGKKLKMVRAA